MKAAAMIIEAGMETEVEMATATERETATEMSTEMMDTEPPSLSNWHKIVHFVQASLREVHMAEESV